MENKIPKVIIDVQGGVVQAIYHDLNVDVILVDWDNIEEGDGAVDYPCNSLAELPSSTLDELKKANVEI